MTLGFQYCCVAAAIMAVTGSAGGGAPPTGPAGSAAQAARPSPSTFYCSAALSLYPIGLALVEQAWNAALSDESDPLVRGEATILYHWLQDVHDAHVSLVEEVEMLRRAHEHEPWFRDWGRPAPPAPPLFSQYFVAQLSPGDPMEPTSFPSLGRARNEAQGPADPFAAAERCGAARSAAGAEAAGAALPRLHTEAAEGRRPRTRSPDMGRLQRRAVFELRYGQLGPAGTWRPSAQLANMLRATVDQISSAIDVSGGRLEARHDEHGQLEVMARGRHQRQHRRGGHGQP